MNETVNIPVMDTLRILLRQLHNMRLTTSLGPIEVNVNSIPIIARTVEGPISSKMFLIDVK